MSKIELQPFEKGPTFQVFAECKAGSFWSAVFQVHGPMDQLRIPAPSPKPAQKDELWKHLCFEVFIAAKGESGYVEWNFSPSGDWAFYEFSDYRKRKQKASKMARSPKLEDLQISRDRLLFEVSFPGPSAKPNGNEINLCAVLEENNGAISYWASKHQGQKPDFHRRADFFHS